MQVRDTKTHAFELVLISTTRNTGTIATILVSTVHKKGRPCSPSHGRAVARVAELDPEGLERSFLVLGHTGVPAGPGLLGLILGSQSGPPGVSLPAVRCHALTLPACTFDFNTGMDSSASERFSGPIAGGGSISSFEITQPGKHYRLGDTVAFVKPQVFDLSSPENCQTHTHTLILLMLAAAKSTPLPAAWRNKCSKCSTLPIAVSP